MIKNFHEREKAATKIQTIFRGRRVRMMQKDTKKQAAAVKIQVCLTCKHAPWKCTYARFEQDAIVLYRKMEEGVLGVRAVSGSGPSRCRRILIRGLQHMFQHWKSRRAVERLCDGRALKHLQNMDATIIQNAYRYLHLYRYNAL